MTVYYTLTFLLLASEMVTFCVLVAPLPYKIRKGLFRFLSESPVIAKVAYGLKISFIFVAILFVDAVQRMFRVAETSTSKQNSHIQDVRTETNYAARRFYAQRNVYLTGFTLFLSLVLTRSFYIILDLIHTQEQYAKLKADTANASRKAGASGDQTKEVEDLKKEVATLKAKERDFETLKKQASQNASNYNRLADDYNKATSSNSDKRVD